MHASGVMRVTHSGRRSRLPLLCALVALLLGACATPDGLAPRGALLAPDEVLATHSLAAVTYSAARWPAPNWWTALGDPGLDALVAEALHDNPDLELAQSRADAAQAAAGLAAAGRLPSATASASISGSHLPGTVLPPPMGGHFGWLQYGYARFKWDIDLWGGQRAAWEAAVGRAQAAEVDLQAARLTLAAAVARAWARLGYAFQQQGLADAELRRAIHVRDLTGQRVDAGISNRLQLERSDAGVAQAQGAQAAAARAVDAARIALSRLLGKGPDRGLRIERPRQPLAPAVLQLPPDVPAQLLGRRPDLVAGRWRVEAAARDIRAARTAFLPNISISALVGLAARGGDALLQLPARFFQVGPAISLPLFDGGRLRADLAGRDADYDGAVARYNQTLVAAVGEVAGHVHDLQGLALQVRAQEQALAAARAAWDLAEQRYRAGVGSFLEALDVRRDLLQAEQGLAALQAEQVDVSLQLMQALGGGYRASPDTATPDRSAARAVPAITREHAS